MANCYLCGTSLKPTFQKKSCQFWSCPLCHLESIDPQPDDHVLSQIYGEHYYEAWGLGKNEPLVKKAKQETFSQYLSLLPGPRPGDRLLDCGAATGYLVELAQKLGWEAYAIEISKFGADACRNILDEDRVHQGEPRNARFSANPEGLFEAITMIDFIEHLRDPRSSLQWARAHLSPKGHLLIVTPDQGSLSRRLMGTYWSHYKIEHLWYFNQDNLSLLLRALNFTITFAGAAPKNLSFHYVLNQFRIHQHPILTPIFKGLDLLLPTRGKQIRLTLRAFCKIHFG